MPRPTERIDYYPHQLSGGLRQRVMIAIALACEPKLLIADEPTTALDVTIQAQILDLIGTLRQELGMAVILITHDMGVIAAETDRVARHVRRQDRRGGATTPALFAAMRHPYSRGAPGLDSAHRPGHARGRCTRSPASPPDLSAPIVGCRFAPRCRYRDGALPTEEDRLLTAVRRRRISRPASTRSTRTEAG